MKRDTIVFDLDGTLLNTLGDIHSAINHAIKSYGFKERTVEEVRNFVGNGIKLAIERCLPKGVSEEDIEKVVSYFKVYYKEHINEKTVVYEGILAVLKELKNKGYKLGVLSNKYDAAVKKLCEKFFADYIEITLGEQKGIEKKPNPQGVYEIVAELDSSVERVIYVGDSEVDIETAKNTGVPCISVLWGFKDRKFLEENGGEYFAQTPRDIIEIIEKINN